jgi:tetratricopeptide (TPR) repeat protein
MVGHSSSTPECSKNFNSQNNQRMEFSPNNHVVKLCLQGMALEEAEKTEAAGKLFLQAWTEATNDLEKFIAAHALARYDPRTAIKLRWFETALEFALAINDVSVEAAFPALYQNIAKCYEELNDPDQANRNYELAVSSKDIPSDNGPFYHGTKADLRIGDLLRAGGNSNYRSEVVMNHIYFTAMLHGAGLAATLAKGEERERVYIVEPTGSFENDPNVTDKKFPGNLTRSYRSTAPLKIVGEVTDWIRQAPEDLQAFRDRLAKSKGEIIN